MLTNNLIIKTIQDNKTQIKTYGVKKLRIFGSFVKATQNNKSDIDVLIEFRKDKKLFDNYMELKFFLEKMLHRKIDLIIKGTLKPRIKERIAKEIIYARL